MSRNNNRSRGRSKGRRYEEPKLNMKKVFAVVLAIIVVLMFILIIKGIFVRGSEHKKIISKDYFVAYKDNKWGVIDEEGNEVISPSYKEMIIIPNSKSDVFLCTYDVNYETGEYKTKALNSKNEEIFTNYSQIEAIQNSDANNNLWYEEKVLKVKQGEKYGIINLEGKEILPCEYEEIVAVSGITNALKIKKENKVGVVDLEGKKILDTQYDDIQALGKDNKSGFIIKQGEKYGIVDYSGNTIIEAKYDKVEKVHENDYYVVKNGSQQILVKKGGEEVLTKGFQEIEQILKNPENGVIYKTSNKYGIMKTNGEISLEANYDYLKEAKTGILIAKQNEKYGIIDINKEQKVDFIYNNITYNEKADIYIAEMQNFEENIIDNTFQVKQTGILIDLDEEKGYFEIKQDDNYKYYNFKFEEKAESEIFTDRTLFLSKENGKYGFKDKNQNVVVDYIYDDAIEQNQYGFAGIKKDGKWGVIDSNGNIIQEPTYNLDEYLKIQFIGRWHLGKDLNMNYYNQL